MRKYYLGCDASKGYCDFSIQDHSKKIIEANFQLDDTYEGHQSLIKTLKAIFTQNPGAVLFAGLESTGGYESNWYNTLMSLKDTLNIRVARLNPRGVKLNMEAGLERNKTDKISARAVAEYLIDHPRKIVYNRKDTKVTLKKLWKFINMLTKQKVQLLNQFESALYNSHPDLLIYCKHKVPEWILKLVMQYPGAARLARARESVVAKIPYVNLQRAKELINNAKQSTGADQDEVAQFRLKSLAQQIYHLRQLIKEQVKTMMGFCPFTEEIEILTSFTGINEFSAVGLMLVIDDINRFKTSDKLCSFIGVHPIFKESGDGSWGFHMSKKGSEAARSILFNVSRCAIVKNDMIKQLYEKYLERKSSKMSAIGIIMHKIARIVYGMLKNKQKYDPQIDEANRKKSGYKKTGTKIEKERRYQLWDDKAPISRRQTRKRREQEESQNGNTIKNEIIAPAQKHSIGI